MLRVGGDFELAWHASDSHVANVPLVLEATGQLLVRIDGRSVNTEARLAVRSFERAVRSVPDAAAARRQADPAESSLACRWCRSRPTTRNKPDDKAGRLIEVRLAEETVGPLDLRLVTERPYNVGQQDEMLELSGFEVPGAVRQWGHIAVQVVGDWQVIWGPQRNVRQIDELPDNLRRENPGGRFRVLRPAIFADGPGRSAEDADQRRAGIPGVGRRASDAIASQMEIQRPRGETADPANRTPRLGDRRQSAPPGLVNPDAALETDGPVCSIPLAQPAAGQFEMTLRAHQAMAGAESELSFEVPRPHADTVSQAIVAVLPADNVELSPRAESMVGLVPQSLQAAHQAARATARPAVLSHRGRPRGSWPACNFTSSRFRPTCRAPSPSTSKTSDVEQRMIFQVAYEPVDSLTVARSPQLAVGRT